MVNYEQLSNETFSSFYVTSKQNKELASKNLWCFWCFFFYSLLVPRYWEILKKCPK